ncbi:MAG: DUF5711 family protein [Clostridiales bacterium]|jgi:hypothetical protein|nr:DUF5711 family protein [Clostridiales bacterium]
MSAKVKISAVIAVIALILSIRLIFFNGGEAAVFSVTAADTEEYLSYSYDSGASFYSFNSKDFFFCTKDGVKFMSSKGGPHWEEIISLTSPVLYGKCDIIAVGESRGRTVYVFNTLGKIMERKFNEPMLSFSVNKSGYLTVILQTASGYRVETYSPGSESAVWQYVMVKPNVYPVSADTSPDGKVTAVSLLDLTPDARHSMTSQILFMYTNESDALKVESADGIFAGETLTDQIARVYFMDTRLLAVSDKTIAAYSLGGKDKIKTDWQFPLQNEISRFCLYGEAGFCFITGEPLPDAAEPQNVGVLNFYGMNGRRTGKFDSDGGAEYLSMNWGDAIVGTGRDYVAVNSRGSLLWRYKAAADLNQLIFLDNENTALTVGSSGASIIRRGA